MGEGKSGLSTLRVIKFCHESRSSSLPISSETSTSICLTDTLFTFTKRVACPWTLMGAPFAASRVADVGLIAAPHCFTMLLLATPIVQPESGVADTLTVCREALLPILQGSIGVSIQGDLNT